MKRRVGGSRLLLLASYLGIGLAAGRKGRARTGGWVEQFIGKMKPYRRIFSRFEKLSTSYRGFLYFAATLIALKQNVNRTSFMSLDDGLRLASYSLSTLNSHCQLSVPTLPP